MTEPTTLIFPGELRAVHLELFEAERDGLSFVCAAPGTMPGGYEGCVKLVREPYASISVEHADAHLSALLRFFAEEIDRLPINELWWERIQNWLASIRGDGTEFRYVPRRPVYTRLVSRPQATLVSTGPLVNSEGELNLDLTGDAHEDARAWATELTSESRDISVHVERVLAESWAGDLLSPEDLYFKVLADYFAPMLDEMDSASDDNVLVDHLTGFQLSAYQAAKGILRRYGGVFLSDVVGLGKTYIALALLKWLEVTHGQRAVVIGPPVVLQQWEVLRLDFGMSFDMVSIGKLSDLHKHKTHDVLVIDESHNFRNSSTLRYETLQEWLRPEGEISTRKAILLSATPQNNAPKDVREQLRLFPDDHEPLPFVGESLDDFFHRVRNNQSRLSELLAHVLIRRTRRFIREHYPRATIRRPTHEDEYEEIPLEFPTRVSGVEQCLRYEIDRAYGGRLYDELIDALTGMHYPLHALYLYVRREHQADARLEGMRRAGASVRGLYKMMLLKRIELSVEAFRISLERPAGDPLVAREGLIQASAIIANERQRRVTGPTGQLA